MRKHWFLMCIIVAILALLFSPAILAESGLNSALSQTQAASPTQIPSSAAATHDAVDSSSPAPTPSPSPVPTPTPVCFEGEGLKLMLPQGFALIGGDALEGFEAALEDDYPDMARTLFVARNTLKDAAVVAVSVETEVDCLDAAREAADALIDDARIVSEAQFGENRCASFACAIGEHGYYLYFFSDGERLLIIGTSGLEGEQGETMLAGMELGELAASPDPTLADTAHVSPNPQPSATSE